MNRTIKGLLCAACMAGALLLTALPARAEETFHIPKLSITLKNVELSEIKQDKHKRYQKNTVILKDTVVPEYNLEQYSVEIKGRGNTTWDQFDKKGYQLNFGKKASVMGMEKAKKWVLLSSPKDDSLMRNYLAMSLAKDLQLPYTPSFKYVELWVDNSYQGLYLIGEKVELGKGRVNLKNADAAIWEMDNAYWKGEKNNFYSQSLQTHFALKDCKDDTDKRKVALVQEEFSAKIDGLMNYLETEAPAKITLEKLGEYINVEELAKYMLLEEYIMNRDSICGMSSCYYYMDGARDVIHPGPVWDLEDSCGVLSSVSPKEYIGTRLFMNYYLLRSPAFRNYLDQIYRQNKTYFDAMPAKAEELGGLLSAAAAKNYTKWKVLGTSFDEDTTYSATYADAVANLSAWLTERNKNFNPKNWKPGPNDTPVNFSSFEELAE